MAPATVSAHDPAAYPGRRPRRLPLRGFSRAGPAAASSFVGCTGERAPLERLVARERLMTVVGPGGCGKTRFAVEWVRDARVPLHGVVELARVGPEADVAAAVLAACGLRAADVAGAGRPDDPVHEDIRTLPAAAAH